MRAIVVVTLLLGIVGFSPSALAQESRAETASTESFWDGLWRAFGSGTPTMNLRLRAEIADADGFKVSQAYNSSLRLGYGTLPHYGLSLFVELEDIRSADDHLYNAAGLNGEPRRTPIADPEGTELNQLFARYEHKSAGLKATAGRQRIILDDARFVGNVGWRLNEQTYDAVRLQSTAVENLLVEYAYVWDVHGIFGDESSAAVPTLRRDFESDSHLVRASFTGIEDLTLTAFAYLLDFHGPNASARMNSSNTYGIRVAGHANVNEDIRVGYTGSYARQADGKDNPLGYVANYFLAEVDTDMKSLGRAFAGYEVLGSDDGRDQFMTPLATAHKFNGFADSFLDNGGPKGLTDIYVGLAPRLPGEFLAEVVYHKFNREDGGGDLGWEVDAKLSKDLRDGVNALVKFAFFDGHADPDLYRLWLQLTFKF